MRFGSTREMLQHYSSESEDEALRKLCVERDLNEREVLRRARGLQSAEALNNAVKKANAFLTYASPYGYDYVDGVLQVKNEEARVVSLIFRRYLEGKGIAKICQELNRDGYRTKTGRAWASQTIANILSNPVYCGLASLNGSGAGFVLTTHSTMCAHNTMVRGDLRGKAYQGSHDDSIDDADARSPVPPEVPEDVRRVSH